MNKRIFPGLAIAGLFTVFLIPSCENLKNDPEYIGEWQMSEVLTADGILYSNIRSLVLTRNTYEEIYVIKRENSTSITAAIGTAGTLETSHSNLIFKLEELGTCVLDEQDACTNVVQWFGPGTSYFNDNIEFFEQTVAGEFDVSGTTLKLIRDLNNDDDTVDEGEDITLEKI
jgi:hypothetical protein